MNEYDFTTGRFEKENLYQMTAFKYRERNGLEEDEAVPFSKEDVATVFEGVDVQSLKDSERGKWSIELYDGGSWRGASEDEMMERVTGDVGYIIDGEEPRKTYFQPFIPFVGGKKPIAEGDWMDVAEAHRERLVERKITGEVVQKILELL